jgi:hypothetical protein
VLSLLDYIKEQSVDGIAKEQMDGDFIIRLMPVFRDNDSCWRWHKWGAYIGVQKHEYEYIRDEENVDLVYAFHIYRLKKRTKGVLIMNAIVNYKMNAANHFLAILKTKHENSENVDTEENVSILKSLSITVQEFCETIYEEKTPRSDYNSYELALSAAGYSTGDVWDFDVNEISEALESENRLYPVIFTESNGNSYVRLCEDPEHSMDETKSGYIVCFNNNGKRTWTEWNTWDEVSTELRRIKTEYRVDIDDTVTVFDKMTEVIYEACK